MRFLVHIGRETVDEGRLYVPEKGDGCQKFLTVDGHGRDLHSFVIV
jgi:hypothetical protein